MWKIPRFFANSKLHFEWSLGLICPSIDSVTRFFTRGLLKQKDSSGPISIIGIFRCRRIEKKEKKKNCRWHRGVTYTGDILGNIFSDSQNNLLKQFCKDIQKFSMIWFATQGVHFQILLTPQTFVQKQNHSLIHIIRHWEVVWWKSQKSKISWHCLFKQKSLLFDFSFSEALLRTIDCLCFMTAQFSRFLIQVLKNHLGVL